MDRDAGSLIARRIEDLDLSQNEAARRVPISPTRLRQFIAGDPPPPKTLARIAFALGITEAELDAIGRSDATPPLRRLHEAQETPGPEMIAPIVEWLREPFRSLPPAELLSLYGDDALLEELARRLDDVRMDRFMRRREAVVDDIDIAAAPKASDRKPPTTGRRQSKTD